MWHQLRNRDFYCMLIADAAAIVAAHLVAYLFRFEFILSPKRINEILTVLPFLVSIKLTFFIFFGVYRSMWRFTGLRDVFRLFQANVAAQLILIAAILYLNRFIGFSRSVFFLDGVLCFMFTVGLRIIVRAKHNSQIRQERKKYHPYHREPGLGKSNGRKAVLLIGAGHAGEIILREIMTNPSTRYKPVGFLDDDPTKRNRTVHGVPVLGPVDQLNKFAPKYKVNEIIIAMPSAGGKQMRRIIELCENSGVPYKTLPGIGDLINGRVSIKALRDVDFQDLLGRAPVSLDNSGIAEYLAGKTVLITGAGGSIGSELCRQLIAFNPGRMVLVDACEANIFHIQAELKNELGFQDIRAILGRVQDQRLMTRIFRKYRPQVVFHAAAYKHVPLVELNPWEGVFNNILGSCVTMETAQEFGVERFVLVSTDKAVRPTNVMGACKRVTELVLQSLCNGSTKFMAVRFGNVVGSSGSVVPFFRRQIAKGGPVTITHPDVTRYFMSIPEASKLILQAGAMGQGGEIFILKMGTPVKIADMARDLIRLCGKRPDQDIDIVYTGLREGEKLYEELITSGEGITQTWHDKIMVLEADQPIDRRNDHEVYQAWLNRQINELCAAAGTFDSPVIKRKLMEIVPEFAPQDVDSIIEERTSPRKDQTEIQGVLPFVRPYHLAR